ncbi:hypothetical protein N7444_006130 [Penicillium canescens]|nr:hypothetical protein N7444_006130 [Penicillium canescens]
MIAFITNPQTYIHLALRNKDHYARLHGYDLFIDYESYSTRGTTWLKFDMVERVINAGQHDWIWYMDFDTLITNHSMSLTNLIYEYLAKAPMPDTIDFLVTDDCNGLNDGSFIVRSSSRSIQFLNAIRAIHDREKEQSGRSLGDQDSMEAFLKSNAPLTQHAMRIPQWTINAFPEEIGCYDTHKKKWEKGMEYLIVSTIYKNHGLLLGPLVTALAGGAQEVVIFAPEEHEAQLPVKNALKTHRITKDTLVHLQRNAG